MKNGLRIIELLNNYSGSSPARFHAPGHKGKKKACGKICKNDIAYIPQADKTNNPFGLIKYTENKIANYLGASKSYVFTDGTKNPLFAMIYALKGLGTHVLIARGVSPIIYDACKLAGLEPLFINMPDEVASGSYTSKVSFKDLNFMSSVSADYYSAVTHNFEAKNICAVIAPAVDQYGFTVDLSKLATYVSGKALLLVDNTFGTYLKFANDPEKQFAGDYATAWVDSPSYSMNALTGSSVLSVSNRFYKNDMNSNASAVSPFMTRYFAQLEEAVNMFRDDTLAFPVLASMEYAFDYFARKGAKAIKKQRNRTDKLLAFLSRYGFRVLEQTANKNKTAVNYNKLVIDCMKSNLVRTRDDLFTSASKGAGFDISLAESVLQDKNVYCEMNDGKNLVFSTSVFNTPSDYRKLRRGLIAVCNKCQGHPYKLPLPDELVKDMVTFGQKSYSASSFIISSNAREHKEADLITASTLQPGKANLGNISALNIGLYPTGYPLVVAGERITPEIASILDQLPPTSLYGVTYEWVSGVKPVIKVQVVKPSKADVNAVNEQIDKETAKNAKAYSEAHEQMYENFVYNPNNPEHIAELSRRLEETKKKMNAKKTEGENMGDKNIAMMDDFVNLFEENNKK